MKQLKGLKWNMLDILVFIALMAFIVACLLTNFFWFDKTPPWKKPKSEQPVIVWPETVSENTQVYGSEFVNCIEIKAIIDTEQLEMLAKIIDAECGDDWCTDELQLYVGSVVLNRVKSDKFPNTIIEVLNQKGQYGGEAHWKNNGRVPTERTYENAKQLLMSGSILPEEVIFQANFTQGKGIYAEIQGVYFCY